MIDLFLGFLQVGCFSFGGAYGAIPLIRDVVLSYGWLDEDALTYMIALSESTPGPIMINIATYVGTSQAGILGALVATSAVVLPSFLVILLITAFMSTALKHPWFQAMLRGMKPGITGIVMATGIQMILHNCGSLSRPDLRSTILTAVLALIFFGSRFLGKKKLSPIGLILLSAVLGAVVYSF